MWKPAASLMASNRMTFNRSKYLIPNTTIERDPIDDMSRAIYAMRHQIHKFHRELGHVQSTWDAVHDNQKSKAAPGGQEASNTGPAGVRIPSSPPLSIQKGTKI